MQKVLKVLMKLVGQVCLLLAKAKQYTGTDAKITNFKMDLHLLQTASKLSSGAVCKLKIAKLKVFESFAKNQKQWKINGMEQNSIPLTNVVYRICKADLHCKSEQKLASSQVQA